MRASVPVGTSEVQVIHRDDIFTVHLVRGHDSVNAESERACNGLQIFRLLDAVGPRPQLAPSCGKGVDHPRFLVERRDRNEFIPDFRNRAFFIM
jgi:hypothetical protein